MLEEFEVQIIKVYNASGYKLGISKASNVISDSKAWMCNCLLNLAFCINISLMKLNSHSVNAELLIYCYLYLK